MRLTNRWFPVCLALLTAVTAWSEPTPAEQRALANAEQSFQLGLWERAEKQFAAFVEKYPKSDDRAQAVLRQARARLKQNKLTGALDLLTAKLREAGGLAPEYQFWLGETHFAATNYAAAAEAYGRLVTTYTNSPRSLEAGYAAALSRSRLGDWTRVSDLLSQPGGAFQLAAGREPTNDFVIRGTLLLAEAQFSRNELRSAEDTLRALADRSLAPELDWRRQFLLCSLQLANGRAAEALVTVTQLTALAAASGQRELQAETAMLKGGILEQLKDPEGAIAAYESNLAEDLPTERRRQAVLKITELLLARNEVAAAAQQLDKFLGEHSKDTAADIALLTVGELHLREFAAAADTNHVELVLTNGTKSFPSYSNHLQQAFAQFDWIVKNFPRSPSLGKAMLDRAWCLWLAGQPAEARAGFQQAAEKLPPSLDKAVARYKWADCQMALGDFAGARTNYQFVLSNYATLPPVKAGLVEPALYQIVRASLQLEDMAGATNALGRLLAGYPDSFLCDRGLLLAGEKLKRTGQPARAREILQQAAQRVVNAPLAAEIRLAIARTYEQERNWTEAISEYDRWLVNFAGHEAQPHVEFSRVWNIVQAGQSADALAAFARFVAQYPTNEFAPLAQNWMADFYLQQGDFVNAEKNYQLVFQNTNWPPSLLTYSARLMAGRAAGGGDRFGEAVGYYTNLINDMSCPPELVAQAFFEYGSATMLMKSAETNDSLANIGEAIRIFNKIPQRYPTNDLAPLALGQIGNCYLQLATRDAKYYDLAAQSYKQVIDSPRAGIAARSQAEVGLGVVLEKQAAQKPADDQAALLKLALERYLNVALASNLHEPERPDAFWVQKAGLEAARVAESLGNWQQAVNLYRRLAEKLPSLRDKFEKKIAAAETSGRREQLTTPAAGR